MKVFNRIKDLQEFLKSARLKKKSIGLVPTMGALHTGHRSLIHKCNAGNDVTVCSIFVNPKQFNNKADLKKYPRNLSEDLRLLKDWNCDVVFVPSVNEMYLSSGIHIEISFGEIENILEGKFRPGHFAGVGIVVSKLFNIISPDSAYFGLKDLQQCFVITQLVKEMSYPIELKFVNTEREKSGLAISSRNMRLTEKERIFAAEIYKALTTAKKTILRTRSIRKGLSDASKVIEKNKYLKLEYLEAIDLDLFTIKKSVGSSKRIAICVAAFVGEVRLIDNVIIKLK